MKKLYKNNNPFLFSAYNGKAKLKCYLMSSKPAKNSSLQIALIYSAAGIIWIFLSDLISNLFFHDVESLVLFQISKGLLFVGLTAVLIYFLVHKQLKRKNHLINFLNKSEHWYNAMLSNIPKVEVFLFSPDGKIILSQGKVLASQGIDISLFAGKALNDTDLSMRAKAFFSPRIDSLLKGNTFNEIFESEKRYYDVHGECLRNEKSEIFAGLVVVTDVTEMYELIAELKESKHKLEELNKDHSIQYMQLIEQNVKLKELNKKIKHAQEKAEESDKLKTAFLTNMSHEVRTPLNGIIGFSEILIANNVSKGEIQDYSRIISQSGSRLLHIMDDVLLMSQIQAEQFQIKADKVIYDQFVQGVTSALQGFVDKNEIRRTLSFDLDTSLTEAILFLDKGAVIKVLTRLLDNAIKFSNQDSEIKIQLLKLESNNLGITVSDHGMGIPEDKRESIFKRFVQVNPNVLTPAAGNGLGLSIVKELLNLMEADISVDSEEGKGSKFTIRIPNVIASQKLNASDMNSNEELPRANKILVVEDVLDNFILIRAYLKRFHVTLHHVITAKDAYKFVEKNPDVDLILMDIRLPDDTGINLTQKLRAIGVKCPIIAQTAYADSKDKFLCLQAGCDDYLAKPIMKSQLLQTLNQFVMLEPVIS